MRLMKTITLSTLLSTTLLFGSFIGGGKSQKYEDELINYYNDGVYDTISQISKEVEEGLNKEEIRNATGKIAILTPLQNISTVDLIFYKTTAVKTNLFNATTVLDESGTPYMLWDLKLREVDSQFVTQKLTERNIPVITKTVNVNNRYYREPVLIRDFIEKIKSNLKDVETKLVVVDKKVYTDEVITKFPEDDVATTTVYSQSTPKNKEYEQNKIDNAPKYNQVTFHTNTLEVSKAIRVGAGDSIFHKLTRIQKNAKIGAFTVSNVRIEDTENNMRYYVTYNEDDAKKEYLIYRKAKPKGQVQKQKVVSSDNSNTTNKEPVKSADKKANSLYKCDFSNIRVVTDKNGNEMKIESGNLFYGKSLTMEAVKKVGNNHLMISTQGGLPEIYLAERYLTNSKYCTKVN